VAASHHGDTPYSGKTITSVPVTPYTTSVDVNYQFRMADDFLLIHRRIFWAEHAASIKTG
jgi:hypothetical protein